MAIKNAVALHGMDIETCYRRVAVSQPAMPLSMVETGEKVRVKSIGGKDEIRRFLGNLGFVEDAEVSVVTKLGGNVIVNVKGTRVAISKVMASRVLTA